VINYERRFEPPIWGRHVDIGPELKVADLTAKETRNDLLEAFKASVSTDMSACVHESIAWTLDLGALRIVGCPLRRTFPNPPSIHLSEKPTSKWKVPNWQSVNASAFSGLILLTGLKQLIWGLGKRNFQSAVLPDSHSWRLALNQ